MRRQRFLLWLLILTGIALGVRLFGINYDQGHFYHPDERRIAEAVNQLSFRPLQANPHFFAYGSFPFYVTKLTTSTLALVRPWYGGYDGAVFVGRALSAIWGAATVLLVGVLGRRLYGDRAGLLAAALLTVTVSHLQNSHFAVNDVALAFLVLAALTAMVRVAEGGGVRATIGAGVLAGFAVATKFSAMPLLLPLAVAMLLGGRGPRRLARTAGSMCLAGACVVVAFVVGEPYALLDHAAFLRDLAEQGQMVRHAGRLPYTNQYVGTLPLLYQLREMVVWGMGPLLGLAAVWGALTRFFRRPRRAEWVLLAWFVPYLAITCSFQVKFPRYLLPTYPLFVLWAAAWLDGWARRRRAGRVATATVVAVTAAYAAAFLAIYTRPHTAVTASEWFYANVPRGAKVLSQDWDEGFPFEFPGRSPSRYTIVNFPFYEPDTQQKIAHLATELATADYAVFQTRRLYGAITQAHEKFPHTSNAFYLLFAGDLGYTMVKEVASRPRLFGVELPSELADESFSVYDHPRAVIFANTARLPAADIQDRILHATPSRPLTRNDLLRAVPTESTAARPPSYLRASVPATLLIAAALEVLGLAGWALLAAAFGPRPGLYALGKVAGVLLFAWSVWLLTSVGATPFSAGAGVAVGTGIAVAGWVSWRRHPASAPRRELGVTELVCWGCFAFFLLLRAANPEIYWGEKPMDFSFLNVLYRTTALPPPEPWFAGSTLSYTYFGHFTLAALGKTLGIHPAVMFNLGVATVAGLVAAGLLAAGTFLGNRLRTGVLAVAVTLFLGNLSGIREVIARRAVNFDYFWATSRVIPNTINEYPFWSLVFADLHAHLLAMPFAVGLVALLLLRVRRVEQGCSRRETAMWCAAAAITLGAIGVANGWSLPAYAGLVAVLLALTVSAGDELTHGWALVRRAAVRWLAPLLAVSGGAFLAYLPFWFSFRPPPRNVGWELGPWALPGDYVAIFGFQLLVVVPFLLLCWRRPVAHRAGIGAARLSLLLAALTATLLNLHGHGPLPARSVGTFAASLSLLALAVVLRRQGDLGHRTLAALAGFAFALTAVCEIVFVWDRMNTVFKFYFEAWLLLGLASAGVLAGLGDLVNSRWRRRVWWAAIGAAGAVAAFTALSGAIGALTYRHTRGPRFTLDGMAYLAQRSAPELAAFEWLSRMVPGVPVVAEAWGPSYQDYSRVAMNTGLPIVLGWDYHVFQRGQAWTEIDRRKRALQVIYGAGDEAAVRAAVARYHISYVWVGPVERRTYPGTGPQRFRQWPDLFKAVFENSAVAIFAVTTATGPAQPTTGVVEVVPEPATAPVETAAGAQDPPGVFRQPRGVACDGSGNIYVADFGNNRIQRLGPDLKPLATWGRRGTAAGEFQDPCGVAVGPDGNVYVADTWNGRVQVFDPDGAFLREWRGDFYGPRGIAVAADGSVFVADTGNARVVRFSADGTREVAWGGRGREAGTLEEPVGIAVGPDQHVYVCDNGNARLAVYDRDGRLLQTFPVPGWRREVFSEPSVAVSSRGGVLVTVPLAGEVRSLRPDSAIGQVLRTASDGAPLVTPIGVAWLGGSDRAVVTQVRGTLAVVAPAPETSPHQPVRRPTTPRRHGAGPR